MKFDDTRWLGIFLGSILIKVSYCEPLIPKLTRTWGEVSFNIPEHRGKSGLVLLQIQPNSKFRVYENTDYGPSTLQTGTWRASQSQNVIKFLVKETTYYRSSTESLPSRLLIHAEGEIEFEIINLSEERLTLRGKRTLLTLKSTELDYFPKERD